MTAQATRDALAEMEGWTHVKQPTDEWDSDTRTMTVFPEHWIRASTNEVRVSHPHAPTLDGADAAVAAARCAWKRAYKFWFGMLPLFDCDGWPKEITVPDTGDKIADLYALALACRRAMEESK